MDKWHSKDEHAKRMGASKARKPSGNQTWQWEKHMWIHWLPEGAYVYIHVYYIYVYMYIYIYICIYIYTYIMYIYVCVCTHAHAHTFIDSSSEFEEPQILISLENVGMVTKRYKKPISSGCWIFPMPSNTQPLVRDEDHKHSCWGPERETLAL